MRVKLILCAGFLILLIVIGVVVISLRTGIEKTEPLADADGEIGSSGKNSKINAELFTKRAIGDSIIGMPWVTDVHIVDLDKDGLKDVLVCEGRTNVVSWIRQVSLGVYEEQIIDNTVAGPAHIESVDIDFDGDLDLLVASMGIISPNSERIGSVVVLENSSNGRFRKHVLAEKMSRVSYVGAGDLDGDGDLDLSVGQFGYFEGEIQWMENLGNWKYQGHSLIDLSGTIHAPIVDIDGDEDLDIVALISQDWEEVHRFENSGSGEFTSSVLYGSTNRDFGSSGLSVADIDSDGDIDILYTNGDGFDYATPGSRQWHGVQWLENLDGLKFEYHRLGDFSGGYSPLPVDIDGDGDIDIIAVSGFNDWSSNESVSMMCFENLGSRQFKSHVLGHNPTHLVIVDGADMDNDGDIDLVTGALHFYPPYENPSRVTLWEQK